jgi:hypothetical protein
MTDPQRESLVVTEIARHQPRLRGLLRCLLVRPSDVDELAQTPVAGDLFKKFDKNGDGAITPDEVSTAGNPGPAMTARGKPLQGKGAGQYEAMIKAVDKDGDGRITKAEAGDPPWFDKVDKNQDGVLDAGEINVLRDAMAKQAGDK